MITIHNSSLPQFPPLPNEFATCQACAGLDFLVCPSASVQLVGDAKNSFSLLHA